MKETVGYIVKTRRLNGSPGSLYLDNPHHVTWTDKKKDAHKWKTRDEAKGWRDTHAEKALVFELVRQRKPVEITLADIVHSGLTIDLVQKEDAQVVQSLKDRVEWFRYRLLSAVRSSGISITDDATDGELSTIDAVISDKFKYLCHQLELTETDRRKMRDERDLCKEELLDTRRILRWCAEDELCTVPTLAKKYVAATRDKIRLLKEYVAKL